MASNAAILDVLTEAIESLVEADALRLTAVAEAARTMRCPAGGAERVEAIHLHRVLGRLLVLTRRNLRLLGCARGLAEGREPERG